MCKGAAEMLETIVTILAGTLLLVVLAGGLFTVVTGVASAITAAVGSRASQGHSGRMALHH